MPPELSNSYTTILGQGLAGSLLAWEFRRAGLAFRIVDPGLERAASLVGAGILNPVTGQRFAVSWRWGEHLPTALETYRDIERALGCRLVREFRIHRLFASERERRIFGERIAAGELGPHVCEWDGAGCWIEGAYQVDLATLVRTMREFFASTGALVVGEEVPAHPAVVIACTGAAQGALPGLKPSEGAILDAKVAVPDSGVILNKGVWVLPDAGDRARAGSTYWEMDTATGERESSLERMRAAAESLVGAAFQDVACRTGWRVTTADRRPIAGWLDAGKTHGVLNGLGSKGALHAPALARMWAAHLARGEALDPDFAPARFVSVENE